MVRLRALLPGLLVAAAMLAEPAAAQNSSGGYRRPAAPSYSAPSYAAPSRRPPVGGSGGYARPAPGAGGYATGSGGDRAFSRGNSAEALQGYRRSQIPPAPPPPVADSRRPSPWNNGGTYAPQPDRRPSTGGSWFGGGYAPAQPRFGVWDAVLAWTLLNAITTPSSARYFQDYRNDPGYQQWRAQADQQAQRDPAVAGKLAQLDQQLAQGTGATSAPTAATQAPPPAAQGSGTTYLVLFILIGAFVLLWFWRRRAAKGGAMPSGPSISGSAATRFRVGMTLPLDPSAFVLAAGATKVTPPEGGAMVSVEAIGVLSDGRGALNRLYLPGRRGFFQLHLGPDGTPDECRWFSQIDEVAPANNDEWAFWLDPAQGMVGWPQFQTKDGKTYGRVWAPGTQRVPPQELQETVQDLSGTTQRKLHAMLYGGPTGLAAPAPPNEYILVAVVEVPGQAWVEIHAGIDINPATLTLPAVPLG